MRKQILKFLILGAAMLGATAMTASAAVNHVFIVSNGTTYSLKTNVTGTATAYQWLTYSGTQVATTQNYTPTSTATGTTATADTFLTRYQTGGATGCWSNYDTVLVYTLPSIAVTVTAQNATVCSNDNADTLTATTNFSTLNFSVLGSVSGITYTNFTWSPMTGATAFGTKDSLLATTQSGSYTATTAYDPAAFTLPMTVNSLPVTGTKVDGTYSNATAVTVTVTTAPDQPTVTIQ